MTIKDVAKKVGVSIAAVSYAINGKEGLTDEKRREILEAVQELGYIPNQQARNLVSKKNALVGIIISDVTTAYNSEIIKYIERYSHKKGKQFMLGCSSGDVDKEKFLLERFISQKLDGIILFPGKNTDKERLLSYENIINNCGTNILIMGEPISGIKCNFVDIRYGDGFSQLTNYLLSDCGFKDIVMFSTREKNIYSEEKERGFLSALKKYNIESEDRIFRVEEEDYDAGRKSIVNYLKDHKLPQAIMAINDITALAIVRQLNKMGYSVPQDVSVTGFDGVDFSQYCDISITSVGFDRKSFSKQCIDLLFAKDDTTKNIEFDLIHGNTTVN